MLHVTIVLCNLSNTTKRILIVNVAYDKKLVTKLVEKKPFLLIANNQ
jgi:hypothetical protein